MFTIRTKVGLFLSKYDRYDDAVQVWSFWETCGVSCHIWFRGQIVEKQF